MKLLLNNGAVMYEAFEIKGKTKAKAIRNAIDEMEKTGLVEKHNSKMGRYITLTSEELINRYCCKYKRNGMYDCSVVDEELLKQWKEKSKESAMQIAKHRKVAKRDVSYRSVRRINVIAERKFHEAEANEVMYLSGVSTLVNEEKEKELGKAAYYDSKEIKADVSYRVSPEILGEDDMTANSRAVGCMVSMGGIYSIYNTGKELQRWSNMLSEESFNNACRNIAKERHNLTTDKRQAIILGHKFKPFINLVQRNERSEEGRKAEKIIGSFYDELYYVPIGENGGKMLTLMQQDYWFDVMKEFMIPDNFEKDPLRIGRGADGITDDEVMLLFTSGNIKQLEMFEQRAIMNPNTKFTLKCFDFMEDALRSIGWPDNITIETESIDDYMTMLEEEGLL